MKYALTVLATLLILGVLVLLFPYTGLYDVAADAGHTGFEQWYLGTLSEHSIKARASRVDVPPDLGDSAWVARGAVAFVQMCQTCHGAPGRERGVTGQGLTPRPPSLHRAGPRDAREVYWVLQHGIKMAGMPAYGLTHTDDELWELVAFVERLPTLTPETYTALTTPLAPPDSTTAPPGHEGHDHTH